MGPTRFRTARLPRFAVSGLHRNVTLLAVVFVAVHVVTTVLDGYTPIGLLDAFVPFVSSYRPVWLGLGAVAFDLLLALIVTSLLRNRLGLRVWRAVHWLAYASWPVALLHALGTGSDARSPWLVALAIGCSIAVVAAVFWRVAAAARGGLLPAIGAGAGAVALALLAFVWYQGGPGRAGWAKRSGTPTRLIASARNAALTGPSAGLPATPFSAPLDGKFAQSGTDANGLVSVALTGLTRGGVNGELHLDLWGQPLTGGGVSMRASRVRFGPTSAPSQYTGSISSLSGQRIVASLTDASGKPLTLTLDLQINSAAGTVAGTVRAQSSAGNG
jgi:ferric reductase like protein